MKIESALIIAVPEADPLVKALRDKFDPSAALGVPAHITILYPFVPPDKITPEVLTELRDLFARSPAFEFALPETRRFPDVFYLAPSPAEPFKALTQAVIERYPAYPPYGGEYTDVTPHLTIADVDDAAQLEAIEREFVRQRGAQLPVKARASEVVLIENSSGRWEVRDAFRLAARG
jgi:2'-5' RNA ligase